MLLLFALGCFRPTTCDTSRWQEDIWWDTGGYDTVDAWTQLEIGVGTTHFLEVPYDRHVAPELVPDDQGPYINVALRAWDLVHQEGNQVTLEAFVGDQRYAADRYEQVDFKCTSWSRAEVGSLRLHLDPSTLPPYSPPPPPDRPEEPVVDEPPPDSGWWEEPQPEPVPFDSGWWWDSGGWQEERLGDVRIVATLAHPEVRTAVVYETTWLVYR